MSDNYVPSAILDARDININKEKFLLIGAYSLEQKTMPIMDNFSKMCSAKLEACSSLKTFQKQLISQGP